MKSIIEGSSVTRLNWQAHLQVKRDLLPVKNELPNSQQCCHGLKHFFLSLNYLSLLKALALVRLTECTKHYVT